MSIGITGLRVLTLLIALFGTGARIGMALQAEMGPNVFFYFTIQSNLMVCFLLAYDLLSRDLLPAKLKQPHPALFGAVAMYIAATGIIYNALLASNLDATGFNALLLQVNHTATPILYFITWLTYQRETRYPVKWSLIWLIYPLAYAIFASVEGGLTGRFRYFFLDFNTRPIGEYVVTAVFILLFFVLLGMLLVGINRLSLRMLMQTG